MPKPNLLEKARKANLTSLAAMTPLLVSCRRPVGRGEGGKLADFWCSYTNKKTTVTNQKNNPARRDSKVVKSKVALRRIFVSPLLLDTLPLSQCLRSARNVTSASIQRAAPAWHRAKRLGISTRWHTAAGILERCGWVPVLTPNYMIHTDATRTRYARDTTAQRRSRERLGCTLTNSAASTHGDAMRKATSRDFHFAPLVESGCDLG